MSISSPVLISPPHHQYVSSSSLSPRENRRRLRSTLLNNSRQFSDEGVCDQFEYIIATGVDVSFIDDSGSVLSPPPAPTQQHGRRKSAVVPMSMLPISASAARCSSEQTTTADSSDVPSFFLASSSVHEGEVSSLLRSSIVLSSRLSSAASSAAPSRVSGMKDVFDLSISVTDQVEREMMTKERCLWNDSAEFLLITHQEASYRLLIMRDVDTTITSIFEACLDHRERLQLTQMEKVHRKWIELEESNDINSSVVVFEDRRKQVHIRDVMRQLVIVEEVKRGDWVHRMMRERDALRGYYDVMWLKTLHPYVVKEEDEKGGQLDSNRTTEDSSSKSARPKQTVALTPHKPSNPSSSTSGRPPPLNAAHRQNGCDDSFADDKECQGFNQPAADQSNGLHSPSPASQYRKVMQSDVERERMAFTSTAGIRNTLIDCEARTRDVILGMWESVADAFGAAQKSMNGWHLGGWREQYEIIAEENVRRRSIHSEYGFLLLEACQALEILHRRHFLHREIPRSFAELRFEERKSWLVARKVETSRFKEEELVGMEADRVNFEAECQGDRDRLTARLRLGRDEADARLSTLLSERRERSDLHENFEKDGHTAFEKQAALMILRERCATTIVWTSESYEEVYMKEAMERNDAVKEEKNDFLKLSSDEVSCYLASRRNFLINQEVANIVSTELEESSRMMELS